MLIDIFIHCMQLLFIEFLILGTEMIRKNKVLSSSERPIRSCRGRELPIESVMSTIAIPLGTGEF